MKKDYNKRFIPKSSPIQPIHYRIIGLNYDAVFSIRTDNEKYLAHKEDCYATLYIELQSYSDKRIEWEGIAILWQDKDCRRVLYRAKSLKDAISHLVVIINKIKK